MTKNSIVLALTAAALSSACHAGDPGEERITGRWLAADTGHQIECPDLLKFQEDGRYTILNDCYGPDMTNPVTEQGNWARGAEGEVSLKSRRFESNYYFADQAKDPLVIEVVSASDDELVLQIESASPEIYKRVGN